MEVPMMQSQPIGQPSFFYYNPEPSNDHRQHGHFSQHPSAGHEDTVFQKTQQFYHPSMMMQHNQPQMMYPQVHHRPILASPQPMKQRPAVLASSECGSLSVNTQCSTPGVNMNSATPALSTASGRSTPPSTGGMFPTPTNPSCFSSHIIEGVKEGCEGDVKNEILAGGDFTRACSPPLTPVFIHPQSLTASQATDLLSINSCPSLSPSPSPGPQSVISDTETNFCNPRNLLVNSTQNTQLILDNFPPLPTLCSGDDEEHKLILGGEYGIVKSDFCLPKAFDSTYHGFPNFDYLSDIDSENDFITDLTRLDNNYYAGNKRQKLELEPFDDDSLLSEDSFEEFDASEQFACAGVMTPPESDMSPVESAPKAKAPKKGRTSAKKINKKSSGRSVSADTETHATYAMDTNDEQSDNKESYAQDSAAGSADDNGAAPDTPVSTTSGNPTARRGRKQSLTDDPSKTFVCTLCSRRFRRQEHLKRHYRSLHTHDKPFKCNECGKQFSRSDNLSQHSRTHGSGAITLGVLEEGELLPHENGEGLDQTEVLGNRLFDAAVAAAGQSSSSSDGSVGSQRDSTSPAPSSEATKTMTKRKRDE